MIDFYWYPKCTTCKKAKKWLNDNEVEVNEIDITEDTPSAAKLQALHEKSGLSIRRFFNTSGIKYRELGLKDKIDHMSLQEAYTLLASDGKLIKRPLTTDGENITLGFSEDSYESTWK